MGYPAGFARQLVGSDDPKIVWEWLERTIIDSSNNLNNRLQAAAHINAYIGKGGPFWVVNANLSNKYLPFGKTGKIDFSDLGFAEHRRVEKSGTVGTPKSVWQLTGPGSVGSQSLMGLPLIHRLSKLQGVAVWPFEPCITAPVVLAEVYPSLLAAAVRASGDAIPDRAQVTLLARALWRLAQAGRLDAMMQVPEIAREEGWILGAGHQDALLDALR